VNRNVGSLVSCKFQRIARSAWLPCYAPDYVYGN
jgi:hypothetical protein